MDNPGVKITAKYKTMMGYEPCEIVFDNCRVPAANMIGAEGEGLQAGTEMARHRPAQSTEGAPSALPGAPSRWAPSTPSSGSPSASRWPSGRPSSSSWRTPIPSSTPPRSWSTTRRGSTTRRRHAQRGLHGQGVCRRDVLPGGGPGAANSWGRGPDHGSPHRAVVPRSAQPAYHGGRVRGHAHGQSRGTCCGSTAEGDPAARVRPETPDPCRITSPTR